MNRVTLSLCSGSCVISHIPRSSLAIFGHVESSAARYGLGWDLGYIQAVVGYVLYIPIIISISVAKS